MKGNFNSVDSVFGSVTTVVRDLPQRSQRFSPRTQRHLRNLKDTYEQIINFNRTLAVFKDKEKMVACTNSCNAFTSGRINHPY